MERKLEIWREVGFSGVNGVMSILAFLLMLLLILFSHIRNWQGERMNQFIGNEELFYSPKIGVALPILSSFLK